MYKRLWKRIFHKIYGKIPKNRRYFSSIFPDISNGQRGSKTLQYNYRAPYYSTLNPKQKGWSSTHLTTRASLPYVKYDALNIYIRSHHIKKILKEYFRDQINYYYFIIKYKNFFQFITKNIKIIIIIFIIVFLISLID